MSKPTSSANRRPLKSRSTGWASLASRGALRLGLGPNLISFLGMVVAALGAWAIVEAPTMPALFVAGGYGLASGKVAEAARIAPVAVAAE